MGEYISREKAIKELREVYENEYPTASGDFDEYASHDVPNVLRNMKAADVQSAEHGKWMDVYTWTMFHEFKSSGRGEHFWCSECKQGQKQKSNYCPNCGADMRGDAE